MTGDSHDAAAARAKMSTTLNPTPTSSTRLTARMVHGRDRRQMHMVELRRLPKHRQAKAKFVATPGRSLVGKKVQLW